MELDAGDRHEAVEAGAAADAPPRRSGRGGEAWNPQVFGAAVKRLRISRGLTLRELAGEGMSVGYLSRLERGERRPTERAATYLAQRLGGTVSMLGETRPASDDVERRLGRLLALAVSGAGAAETELIEQIVGCLADPRPSTPQSIWQARWTLAKHFGDRGEYATELQHLLELSKVSEELDEPCLAVRANTRLARCQLVLGSTADALGTAGRAYALAEHGAVPPEDATEALMVLISVEAEAGLLSEAVKHVKALLTIVPAAAAATRTRAHWYAAMVRSRFGEDDAAAEQMETAFAILDCWDDPALWLRLRLAGASLFLQAQPPRLDRAKQCLDEAATALAFLAAPRHRQEHLLLRARLAMENGAFDEVEQLCQALDDAPLLLGHRDVTRLAMLRGRLLIHRGSVAEGIRALEKLAAEAREGLNVELAADVWRCYAQALARETQSG